MRVKVTQGEERPLEADNDNLEQSPCKLVEVVVCSLSVKSWLQLVGRVEEILRILVRIRHELLAFTELLALAILPAQCFHEIMMGAHSFHEVCMCLTEVATSSLDSSEFLPCSFLSSFELAKQPWLSFMLTLSL